MTKPRKRPRDPAQLAKLMIDIASGEVEDETTTQRGNRLRIARLEAPCKASPATGVTTKALGKGTGLGLAQVYGFSHQSGGTVVATSAVGSGTTITIYLPRRQAIPVETVQAPPTQPIVPGEGTILVVEDNAEVADITASLVEQLGYQTARAGNAADALNRLRRGDKVDLVFSDVVMPGEMNGIALAHEIANHYPQIPVVLTSGYSDVVHTAQARFTILRKPFQLSALEKSIREALERRATRDDGDRVLQFARGRGTTGRE